LWILEEDMGKEEFYEGKNEINEMWRRVEQETMDYVPEEYLKKMGVELDEVLGVWCAKEH